MADVEDKDRIAALEAEVASLRAQLGEDERAGAEGGGLSGAGDASFDAPASRAKVLMVSSIVVVVALALMFGIFAALSKGFDRFADKAAEQFVPQGGTEQGGVPTTKVAPPPPPADAGSSREPIVVPGL